MPLTYRLLEHDDLPGLRRLWEDNTNWGTLTSQIWRDFVTDGPLGGAGGVVAIDTRSGELMGQFAFIPALVDVAGREVRAFRPGAPIVSKLAREAVSNPFHHPAAAMYMSAVKALRARGDGLIYMVPDPRWMRFFKLFLTAAPNLSVGTFPLWRVSLPLAAALPLGDGYSAVAVEPNDPRIDALWAATKRQYGSAVVRHSQALPSKLVGATYDVLGVERGGDLVGVTTSRAKGDRQWLVCDVLAADSGGSLRATLAAVCNLANERAASGDPARPIRKVAVLATPAMQAAARSLGFERDAYDFPLVVHQLDGTLPKADLHPSRWYISAND